MLSESANSGEEASGISILIVDDEPALGSLLKMSLLRVGYDVTLAASGQEALALFDKRAYDLVLLDVMMPDLDGLEVCRALRLRSDVIIIMLTGKSQTADIVSGLNLGADAYITKPFIFKELEAHITALLRRAGKQSAPDRFPATVFRVLTLQNKTRQVTIGETQVELTKLEFDLLAFLAQRAGRPIGKEELLRSVWGYEAGNNDNIVELAIRRLRQKIEHDPSNPERLLTVRGVGYVLSAEPDAAHPQHPASPAATRDRAQPGDVQHRSTDQRLKG